MNNTTFSNNVQYQSVLSNLEKNNGQLKCDCCGKFLASKSEYHFDYILPPSKGGEATVKNCQIICANCHSLKNSENEDVLEKYTIKEHKISQNLLMHILLVLLLGRMWILPWVYRTTKLLNQAKGLPSWDATEALLLFIFIPFYPILWYNKAARRVEYLSECANVRTSFSGPCTVLAIFFPQIASIFLQMEIDQVLEYEFDTAPVKKNNAATLPSSNSNEEQVEWVPFIDNSSVSNLFSEKSNDGEVKLLCPNCQKTLRFPESHIGKKKNCPFCSERFKVNVL